MRVFTFHLFNDYSGSPKVLMQLVKAWSKRGIEVHVCTGTNHNGFLSNIPNVTYYSVWYNYIDYNLIRLCIYLWNQFCLFFKMFFKIKKDDIVYVNTILPFAAGILGKIKGCRVIYHVHEDTMEPPLLRWFLFNMVELTASDLISVSKFVEDNHGINVKNCRTYILYNAIEDDFLAKAKASGQEPATNPKNVLMVCSLKTYKGIFEYMKLAESCPDYTFQLVLNADQKAINRFFHRLEVPKNLELFPVQSNLHPFYEKADIILNLSLPDVFIETFGLTLIEGMAYGLPSIGPNAGGIPEVLEDGKTGFLVNPHDIEQLKKCITTVFSDPVLYKQMSKNALEKLEEFSEEMLIRKSLDILNLPK